jgi:NAD(P)H dehydrogenase (quinone)
MALNRTKTSFLGVDTSQNALAIDHRASESYLKASGAAWTMLRNSVYADGWVTAAAKWVAAGRVSVPPNDSKIAYVTRADCAAAAAGALTKPGQEHKAYDITGPELLDTRDVARYSQ